MKFLRSPKYVAAMFIFSMALGYAASSSSSSEGSEPRSVYYSGPESSDTEVLYAAYPKIACKEDNDGRYRKYTLIECMEKCKTRGCNAFVYDNASPGDDNPPSNGGHGLCKLYDDCTYKRASKGVLFRPQ